VFRSFEERHEREVGRPDRSVFGHDFNRLMEDQKHIWNLHAMTDGAIGRMVRVVRGNLAVGIEKLALRPDDFGLFYPEPGQHCKLFEVYDVLGEMVEKSLGSPFGHRKIYGKDANEILTTDIAWMTNHEAIEKGYAKPVHFPLGLAEGTAAE